MKWYRNEAMFLVAAASTCFQFYGCTSGGSGNLVPIRTKIHIQPYEVLSTAQRSISLKCLVEPYSSPCASAVMSESASGNSYTIYFSGIYVSPNPCVAIVVPLISTVNLGSLPPGSYQLNFIVNGVRNTLGLSVNDTSITLSGSDTSWVNYTNAVLMRVPSKALWGSASYGAGMDTVVNSFLDSLKLIGATASVLADGDYYYFTVDYGEVTSTNPIATPLSGIRYFSFNYDGSFDSVARLAYSYMVRYRNSLYMNIYDAAGNKFPVLVVVTNSRQR